MNRQTHIPKFPLNNFIDYFIYHESYNPADSDDRILSARKNDKIVKLRQDSNHRSQ